MQFLAFVLKQLRAVVAPTLFFVIGFNIIALTTQLILADYLIHFANFILVTMSALILRPIPDLQPGLRTQFVVR
jgi:hypothetical protein